MNSLRVAVESVQQQCVAPGSERDLQQMCISTSEACRDARQTAGRHPPLCRMLFYSQRKLLQQGVNACTRSEATDATSV